MTDEKDFFEIFNDAEDDQPFTAEQLARVERLNRREERSRSAVTAKAKKLHAGLLRLERFAIANDVIFMPFHELLLDSIRCFEGFISDYDPEYLRAFPPIPVSDDAKDIAPKASPSESEAVADELPLAPASDAGDVLDGINRQMRARNIGECAIVEHLRCQSYSACLYLPVSFRDSATVAKWFQSLGASAVVIDHTLYSDVNDDREGQIKGSQSQAWTVYFDLPNVAQAAE